MLAICGARSAPMCWLYVMLGAHLCVGYMWCLKGIYVLAICGAWSAPMCWLYVLWGAWSALVQEGSGPCKIPNFSHLLWNDGTYMHFVRLVCIDPQQS